MRHKPLAPLTQCPVGRELLEKVREAKSAVLGAGSKVGLPAAQQSLWPEGTSLCMHTLQCVCAGSVCVCVHRCRATHQGLPCIQSHSTALAVPSLLSTTQVPTGPPAIQMGHSITCAPARQRLASMGLGCSKDDLARRAGWCWLGGHQDHCFQTQRSTRPRPRRPLLCTSLAPRQIPLSSQCPGVNQDAHQTHRKSL